MERIGFTPVWPHEARPYLVVIANSIYTRRDLSDRIPGNEAASS